MTFRTQMAADLLHMLDTDVGAESCDVDGSTVTLIRQPVGADEYPPEPGILVERVRCWLRLSDLGYMPEPGSTVEIDGEAWEVEHIAAWVGQVLQLTIKRYLS